jgi:ribosomal protein L2
MSIRLYKSYTPGTRNRHYQRLVKLQKLNQKSLIRKNHRNKGRNNRGLLRFVIEVVVIKTLSNDRF